MWCGLTHARTLSWESARWYKPNPRRLMDADQGLMLNPGLVLYASIDMSRETSLSTAPLFHQCPPLPSPDFSPVPVPPGNIPQRRPTACTLGRPPRLSIGLETRSKALWKSGFVNSEMLFDLSSHYSCLSKLSVGTTETAWRTRPYTIVHLQFSLTKSVSALQLLLILTRPWVKRVCYRFMSTEEI